MLPKILLFALLVASARANVECLHRDYGNTGTVCVCNANHCDTIDPIEQVGEGQFVTYTSNLDGKRFDRVVEEFVSAGDADADLIDHSETYQTINGFGGAFTDAAGINIMSLDSAAREHIMRSYFSDEGIEFSLCRVPIAGTDFSTRSYSYLDTEEPDLELSAFALQDEDFNFKIPLILEALTLTNNNLNLFASAWTAPIWMKTNNAASGRGSLKTEYYQLWVDYFVKFLDLYKEQGIEYWGLTTGNEPSLAFFTFTNINTVGWMPWTVNTWIAENLGPTIRASEYSDIKLIGHDDQRLLLPFVNSIFTNTVARGFIDGIGVHWYWDDFIPASWQSNMQARYPEKFFLNTEACKGDRPWDTNVILGSWSRGEKYALNIIENLQHWSTGWVDWNMALNTEGGPTYIDNFVDAAIIVDAEAGEFLKQPMFYALGHYSKFISRGSVKIELPQEQNGVTLIALDRLDGATVVVAINSQDSDAQINLLDSNRGYITKEISAKSFNTIIYW